MPKKKFYLTLDTETATLPFADKICDNANDKKKIAIAKPICYDIGWIITDRKGKEIKKESFLVQETFYNTAVFDTGYYHEKRPIYIEKLSRGEIKVAPWEDIMNMLIFDLAACDIALAFNACFDFKRSIPFTERYMKAFYSKNYYKWEAKQKQKCEGLIRGIEKPKNPEYLDPIFKLRGGEYPICDLWGIACQTLINNCRFKDYCCQNEKFTDSAMFFKTSAENVFAYLTHDVTFKESHTALEDAIIESQILTKVLKKIGIKPGITPFPFRELGTTVDYARNRYKGKYRGKVKEALFAYIEINNGFNKAEIYKEPYWKRIVNTWNSL